MSPRHRLLKIDVLRVLHAAVLALTLVAPALLSRAEPLTLASAVSSSTDDAATMMASVIDGVEAGPLGWTVGPPTTEPQAMVFSLAEPATAAEFDLTLFFLSGQPRAAIAEFTIDYTTDATPSLTGNWQPVVLQRFTAEVAHLQLTPAGHLSASPLPRVMTGTIPDDTYRLSIIVPEGRVTGFRLRVFPVPNIDPKEPVRLTWCASAERFVLTEFQVEEHPRSSTNLALRCPVKASHPLFNQMLASALTDGLPATIAHPAAPHLGAAFHFDLDLGRSVTLDHVGLRGRGDGYAERLSRLQVQLYETAPDAGGAPAWTGIDRPDGSHPGPGQIDHLRAQQGKGVFRGRYLRLSSDNPAALSPQLAEVEAYETRTPEVATASADGQELPLGPTLRIPAGVRRLSLRLRIPQLGMPPGVVFRWRVRGDFNGWTDSRSLTIDLPCPPPGDTFFEAQALHSDREWDGSLVSLPIRTQRHFWQAPLFRWSTGCALLVGAVGLGRFLTRRHAARQLALVQARASVAEERARIARDLHDDLGANLARIGFLTELAGVYLTDPDRARGQLDKITATARDLGRQLDAVVWAVDPVHDTLESVARYLHGHAEEYLGMAQIRCHFISAAEMPAVHLGSSFRNHLLMIMKEALHNIVAHSRATVVTLSLTVAGPRLVVEVTDNGCGLPSHETLKPGNGLENMQKRAAMIGGTCTFSPAPTGTGMRIRLVLPLPTAKTPGATR